ncbi:hypothetical protein BS78_04G159200 [Paspalum vaginatum]|nr:hypothetical protein BS78_04G159200 [Paspalum vaginatum]
MAAAAAPAAGTGKGKRKRPLSEDDVYLLLHRYAPSTILTALQEVAQHADGRRIDWRALVRKSTTGITSPREYQMLWRHFAYHHDLDESLDAGDQPLGDDSDLEVELELVPDPTTEALSEATALAKALISGSSRDQATGHRINLDAPALNGPNEKITRVSSEKQLAQSHRITNVTGPVPNSKHASHLGPSPGPLDPNGASKKKKKTKAWSKEEDADLAAGVQKYGEGNWEVILQECNFDNTRTPDQLSQRWALICKRPGGPAKPASAKHVSFTSSEERRAALNAFTMAVGPAPARGSMLRPGAHQQSIQHKSTAFAPKAPEVRSAAAPSPARAPAPAPAPALALPVPAPAPAQAARPLPGAVQVQSPLHQGQHAPARAVPPKQPNASNKTRKKQAAKPNPTIIPSSIQAAAIAAGGRLAPASTAANFLKVAQSKNAVHIRPQGVGPSQPSASYKASAAVVDPGTQPGVSLHVEHPNARAPKSGPSVLATHATEQVHGVSEVTAANQPGPLAGAHLVETKKASSTTPMPVSCSSEEKDDDSKLFELSIDDLFPEDAKQLEALDTKAKQPETVDTKAKQLETVDTKAKQPDTTDSKVGVVDPKDKDMLEFDQFVASQGHLNMDHLNKSKSAKSASQAQGLVGSQRKSVVGRGNPVSAGAPAAGKKTRAVPHLAAGSPRGIVVTVNANAQNKTLARKSTGPVPAGSQAPPLKKQAMNGRGNQMAPSNATVLGSGAPTSSQTGAAVSGATASKANPPSSSGQVSAVVSIASKVNAPSSSQASTAVNGANRATGNQASAAMTGANRAANPSSSSQASAVVNGANRATSNQASAAVTGANRAANPSSSSQASAVVNGADKAANPPPAARLGPT